MSMVVLSYVTTYFIWSAAYYLLFRAKTSFWAW